MFLIFLLGLFVVYAQAEDKCTTPNNENALCIPLESCPVLNSVKDDPKSYAFIVQSACGNKLDTTLVCCGTLSNFAEGENTFVDEDVCGFQHSDDYKHTENKPVLTESPWLALIAYKDKQGTTLPINTRYKCSGSLIGKKHILTSAECLTLKDVIPSHVRLGEYDTANKTDCFEESNVLECSDAVRDYAIKQIIVHPDYDEKHRKNNIGLIRLDKTVLYSDYIRPICLSSPDKTKAQVGDTLVSSSWQKRVESDTETKIITSRTLITNEVCRTYYKTDDVLFDGVMCGHPKESNNGLCYGNLGSPILFSHKWRWHQEGILSHRERCGFLFPEVYTRVEYYLDWIKEKVES
ncbi:hypothetical protein ILUMI_10342 [Ignelater luminosus]|uniref:CLIP domain-containing serine protease n=1 Tax=Ignelater luminosus TaxID=2038154 RepID=A0A8K0D3G3_IGNLU|nr:hypothetical protein ILUMI_10342 [Ignelater luminosus]